MTRFRNDRYEDDRDDRQGAGRRSRSDFSGSTDMDRQYGQDQYGQDQTRRSMGMGSDAYCDTQDFRDSGMMGSGNRQGSFGAGMTEDRYDRMGRPTGGIGYGADSGLGSMGGMGSYRQSNSDQSSFGQRGFGQRDSTGQAQLGRDFGQSSYGQPSHDQPSYDQSRPGQGSYGQFSYSPLGSVGQDRYSQGDRYGQSAVGGSVAGLGQGQSHRGKGPKGYQRSDERIKEEVSDALHDDHYVDASEIEVQVQGGEVTLTGTVSDRQQKRHAEDCVERVRGVKDVHNHVRVQSGGMSGHSDMSGQDMSSVSLPSGSDLTTGSRDTGETATVTTPGSSLAQDSTTQDSTSQGSSIAGEDHRQ